jgi:excisionase family DNA binding protein
MMRLHDRIRRILDGMPPGSSVILRVDDLQEWLAEETADDRQEDVLQPPDLTVAQVAARFDRSDQTVRDWIKQGRLRAYKLNDREYRITPAALVEFEEQQRSGRKETVASRRRADLGAWRRVQSKERVP